MALIDNAEKFCVGNTMIDADHRSLIEHLNQLEVAVTAGAAHEMQKTLLEGLISFADGHFKREEGVMRKMDYRGYDKHKTEHDMLLDEVRELQTRFNSGSITLNDSLFDYLSEWLTFHTVTTDKKLADAIAAAGK